MYGNRLYNGYNGGLEYDERREKVVWGSPLKGRSQVLCQMVLKLVDQRGPSLCGYHCHQPLTSADHHQAQRTEAFTKSKI